MHQMAMILHATLEENQSNVLTCGFYREWDKVGENTVEIQVERVTILAKQMEQAAKEMKPIITLIYSLIN